MAVKKSRGDLSIGEVSARTGIAASAIRYYEKERLLRAPPRVGGKRRFDSAAVARLQMIRLAQRVGFTVDQVRQLLVGFDRDGLPATWKRMAAKKLDQLREDAARIAVMQAILAEALECDCADLEACVDAARRRKVI